MTFEQVNVNETFGINGNPLLGSVSEMLMESCKDLILLIEYLQYQHVWNTTPLLIHLLEDSLPHPGEIRKNRIPMM
jgi:hypothetical protein